MNTLIGIIDIAINYFIKIYDVHFLSRLRRFIEHLLQFLN